MVFSSTIGSAGIVDEARSVLMAEDLTARDGETGKALGNECQEVQTWF